MKKFFKIYNKIDKRTLAICGCLLLIVTLLCPSFVIAGIGVHIAALITVSPALNELRKKAGSVVFSKNHYGQFIRKRVKGTNPRTNSQLNVRADMTTLAKGFKNLGSSAIVAWNTYGKNYYKSNRLGLKIQLTGEAWYIKLGRICQTIGVTVPGSPPSLTQAVPELLETLSAAIVASTSITLSCDTAPSANNYVRIFASPANSLGRNYNSNYRFIGLWKTADTATKDVTTLWTAVFGSVPPAGSRIFFKAISTDNVTGVENQAQGFSGSI